MCLSIYLSTFLPGDPEPVAVRRDGVITHIMAEELTNQMAATKLRYIMSLPFRRKPHIDSRYSDTIKRPPKDNRPQTEAGYTLVHRYSFSINHCYRT